ncbi:hypothetical protein [Alkalicoccobacillus porphyridii]|uniref:DUF4190 domain-containing protein n=1 Tax=Alkalicoccobacillus porphyridii TaxID=2597270 RepID=A0A554A0K9_9BACI|nr:hypothetical protein [Alkalicoccobacillus porphyridii]TSB47234.1 hypothetical protein FN960_05700 [Alkalicoccobacillus porphyridii]
MTTQSNTTQQSTAIGALVLAIVSLFVPLLGLVAAIIALVMISKVTDEEQLGLKTATKVIAWISIALEVVFVIFAFFGVISFFYI